MLETGLFLHYYPPYKNSHILNESGIFQKKIPLIMPTQNVQPKQKNFHETIN